MTKLEKYIRICKKYLIIRNTSYIDIVFGVIMANRLDSSPVWLYLVGVPSSGKTAILQPLAGHPEIYALSRVSRNALISGYGQGKKKKKDKEKPRDYSLLPRLDGKTVIIKDFTAMLCMKSQDLHEVLGQLRDAYDGTARSVFGSGFERTYKSKFGIIAAVTGSIDKQRPLLTELGERFLTYRLPEVSHYEQYQRCMKAMSIESWQEQEEHLARAACDVLDIRPPEPSLGENHKRRIFEIAEFAAVARCSVERDRFTQEVEPPQPEVAIRISKQLGDLAKGIAMAREKKAVTMEEVRLVQKVALHSLTYKRLLLLKTLLSNYPQYITVREITEAMKFPEPTVRRHIEDLLLLNLVDRKTVYEKKMTPVYHFKLKKDTIIRKVLGDEGLSD